MSRILDKSKFVEKLIVGDYLEIVSLVMGRVLDNFSYDEIREIISQVEISENNSLRIEVLEFIYYHFDDEREVLNLKEIKFLIEHPHIKLLELIIKFSNIFFNNEGKVIGDYRLWLYSLFKKLFKANSLYLKEAFDGLLNVTYRSKDSIIRPNYESMDEITFVLYNKLKHLFKNAHEEQVYFLGDLGYNALLDSIRCRKQKNGE